MDEQEYMLTISFNSDKSDLVLRKEYTGEEHWDEVLQDFIDMLNNRGYIIRDKEVTIDSNGQIDQVKDTTNSL